MEGETEDLMPCSSAVGILPSGIFKRLVCVCWLHCITCSEWGELPIDAVGGGISVVLGEEVWIDGLEMGGDGIQV